MRHELRVVNGGGERRGPGDFERRVVDNVIHLSKRSWYGHRPPSSIEIGDAVLPHLDEEVRGVAAEMVRVFLEMAGESWLQSRSGYGLFVSLSRSPWEPVGKKRPKTRMGIPDPQWSVTVRPLPEEQYPHFFHVHLPPVVGSGVIVPFTRMWGHPTRCSGTRNLVTFVREGEGWRPVDHVSAYLTRNYHDGPTICPTRIRRPEQG